MIRKTILIIIILLLFIFLYKYKLLNYNKENFKMYQTYPNTIYSKWRTGSEPLNYYNYPIYRKPYRQGFVFNQSYPIQHLNSLGFELSN